MQDRYRHYKKRNWRVRNISVNDEENNNNLVNFARQQAKVEEINEEAVLVKLAPRSYHYTWIKRVVLAILYLSQIIPSLGLNPTLSTSSVQRLKGSWGISPSKHLDNTRNTKSRLESSKKVIPDSRPRHLSSQQQKASSSNVSKNNKVYYTPSKQAIKTMFKGAQQKMKTGEFGKASQLLKQILKMDPYDSHSYLALGRLESRRELASQISVFPNSISGVSSEKTQDRETLNPSTPSWATLLEEERPLDGLHKSVARNTFDLGTSKCPDSVHLWQAWAVHEQSLGHLNRAKELYERALTIDPTNPYVCHAYGLMMWQRLARPDKARRLWQNALTKHSTAALVCSLGELETIQGNLDKAREIYATHLPKLRVKDCERETVEVYLSAAWLEDRNQKKFFASSNITASLTTPESILEEALKYYPENSRIQVALARLQARTSNASDFKNLIVPRSDTYSQELSTESTATEQQDSPNQSSSTLANFKLSEACEQMVISSESLREQNRIRNLLQKAKYQDNQVRHANSQASESNPPQYTSARASRAQDDDQLTSLRARKGSDGRLYNAWAKLEVKGGRLRNAKRILLEGIKKFPRDHSLQQAAGKVEERLGNFARARDYFAESLRLQPSAPALVAYALLELRHPVGGLAQVDQPNNSTTIRTRANITKVEKLFEEALLIDPRHGPTYNAYGCLASRRGDLEKARRIFKSGIRAHCNDPASVYHGYAKLELAAANVELARDILVAGLKEVQRQEEGLRMIEAHQRQRLRATFLVHTLGMLELKRNKVVCAKQVFVDGLDRYGNSSQLLLGAALCDVKLGQQNSARQYFKHSVLADRNHAHAWHAWGIMEQRTGNFRMAKTLYENGLQSSPKHGPLWHSYASMERRLGNLTNSRILFAAGVAKCPAHIPLYHGWASLELSADNVFAAKRLVGEALTRDKTQGSGWLIAARIEERQGKDGLVGLILRRGLECAPTSPELYCALADDLMNQRPPNVIEARKVLERGLEVDPANAPLYHSLAELEASVFNLEGLARLNKRAATIFNNNAMEPSKASTEVWEQKLKLYEKSSETSSFLGDLDGLFESTLASADPDLILRGMASFEDDVVGEIFSSTSDDIEHERAQNHRRDQEQNL